MIAIDLGSNTFRVVEYDCNTGDFVQDFERIVRTADGIHRTGVISSGAIQRIIDAAKEARKRFDFDAQAIVAVTTAAMRMAANASEALARISREGGIAFRIIDDAEEAALTMLAVRHRLERLKRPADELVLIDIGGGSTEVMFSRHGVFESRSFPVGIVTVAQQCDGPDDVRRALQTLLDPVRAYVSESYRISGKPRSFVATAGTPTTIAAFLQGMTYETYDPERINGTTLTREECGEALQGLLALDDATRAVYVGVGKETLIVAGVVIVEAFFELLGFSEATIVDDGLREGVAIDYCQKLRESSAEP